MNDLTPRESASLRDRVIAGADGITRRRQQRSRMVATAAAVAAVAAVSIGVTTLAYGRGPVTASVPTPSPSQSSTPSPSATSTLSPTATPAPTQTPPPSPAPPPAVTLEVGDELTASEQWNILGERGWGYWEMPGGHYIAVDPAAALPAAVMADIQGRMDAIPNNVPTDRDGTIALTDSKNLMLMVMYSTQKQVIGLRYNALSTPNDPAGDISMRWYAQSTTDGWWMQSMKSRDQLLSDVKAWVAAQSDPSRWLVVVGPGEPVAP